MKIKEFLGLFFILTTSLSAFDWSINEYIDKCSVVYQKQISNTDKETVGYCMGILKGTLNGIIITRSIESTESKIPQCLLKDGNIKFWEVQKNILAIMRLQYKHLKSANEPNTANPAVAFALIDLYPCLLD